MLVFCLGGFWISHWSHSLSIINRESSLRLLDPKYILGCIHPKELHNHFHSEYWNMCMFQYCPPLVFQYLGPKVYFFLNVYSDQDQLTSLVQFYLPCSWVCALLPAIVKGPIYQPEQTAGNDFPIEEFTIAWCSLFSWIGLNHQ